jgi:hypothetical protein
MDSALKKKGRLARLFLYFAMILAACAAYVLTHPLVFNESFFFHSHCIASAGLGFEAYAQDHLGKFPISTNGYGDALLQMKEEFGISWDEATGPGYTGKVFQDAIGKGGHVPEESCGRVYVQGLAKSNDPSIALFFDKTATPGGGHCHLFKRLWTPLGREIWTIGEGHNFIYQSEWNQFATNQIRLLTEAGIPKQEAERLYAPTLK